MTRVFKFGGTSLGTPESIENVATIISTEAETGCAPVVVCSAHSGVTNLLFAAATKALAGDEDAVVAVRERQLTLIDQLGLSQDLVLDLLERLERLLSGVSMLGELSPRSLDYVASFGERMSCRVMAAYLRKLGLKAQSFDAWDLGLVTDKKFGHARPLPESAALIEAKVKEVLAEGVLPIVTGYVAKSQDGCITTLGRNGSDFSAAIFGAAIDSEEIQIWTDVSGILTTDPRVVDEAQLIAAMSFDEAAELANYGAKVIHPSTLTPAVEKDIAIRVKNTHEPAAAGTVIVSESRQSRAVAKAIAHKTNVTLVHIHSTRMLGRPGFLAKIAKVFQIHRIDVDMIATSEVSVSLTVEDDQHLAKAVARLAKFAEVTVVKERAIVCVVGHGLADSPQTLALVFQALAKVDVAPDLISQGASRLNLGLVVAENRVVDVVRALHSQLFQPVTQG